MKNRIKIFAGNAGNNLALEVCQRLSVPLGKALVGRFADGEVNVQLNEDVRGADVFILNPTHPPAENFLEMVLLADAARNASAERITLVPTYLGYNRQDRKDAPRKSIAAQVMIQFLSGTSVNRALLFDLHSASTAGFFKPLVVDHLFASYVSISVLKERLKDRPFVVASPDAGGVPRAQAYAKLLGQEDFVVFSKIRKEGQVQSDSIKIIGDVKEKDVIFVDDMIDTGGTMIADAVAAQKAGAKDIFVFATHGLFSKDAVARLDDSPVSQVFVTDTIPQDDNVLKPKRVKITVIPIAPLVALAIRSIHDGESVSRLILQS